MPNPIFQNEIDALTPPGDIRPTGAAIIPSGQGPNAAVDAEKKAQDLEDARRRAAVERGEALPPPKVLPDAAVNAIQENLKALREVRTTLQALKSRPQSIGPGTGTFGEWFTQWNDPGGQKVRGRVGEIGATKIHDLSGAAVSATEAPRFSPFVPTNQDFPDAAQKKLEQFEENLSADINEQLNAFTPKNGYLPYRTPAADEFRLKYHSTANITDEEARAGMQERIRRGDKPADTIKWLMEHNRPPTDEDIAAITKGTGDPRAQVVTPDDKKEGKGGDDAFEVPQFVKDFGSSTKNIVAGMAKGALALPDMIAKQAGSEMGDIADLVGQPEIGSQLRNTFQFGDQIDKYSPQPEGALNWINRKGGEVVGATLGMPARATTALVEGIVGRAPRPVIQLATPGSKIAAAAERQNVEMLPADVGGETVKGLTAAAAQAPFSRASIVAGARAGQEGLKVAAARAANQEGRILHPDEAGEGVRRGGVQYIKQITDRGRRWYDKANEWADNMKIMPASGIKRLEDAIAEFKQAGKVGEPLVKEFQQALDTLKQQGGITVTGLRIARTTLRAKANNSEALRGTPAGTIFGEALDAASNDMAAQLVAAGKGNAARMFKRADALWKGRIETIDKVLEPIIGEGKSGEDILNAIQSMSGGSRGGIRALERVMATLPADEKANTVSTIISRLGRATPGAQNAEGTVFSSETFLSNWNRMTDKGKRALFGRGDLRRTLDDIAELASAKRLTGQIASKSNTPMGIAANVGTLAGAGSAGGWLLGMAIPKVAATMAALQWGSGKILASKVLTRWLGRMPTGHKAAFQHIARLETIAAANPAIAKDALDLRDHLMGANQQPAEEPQ